MDVTHVSHQEVQRSRRGRRGVSSNSDVALVRGGSRFAVLTESDDESDEEPLIRPAGQTRNEDDPVAAHLGAINGDAGQVEFDMTLMDADTESLSTHSAGQVEHQQVQVITSSRIRRRHGRLHWNEQVSQVTHREVRAAANVVENLGRRIGSVPVEGDIPRIVRHQRWSPLNISLFWAAAKRFTILPCVGVDHGGSITDHPTTPFPRRTDQSARSSTSDRFCDHGGSHRGNI